MQFSISSAAVSSSVPSGPSLPSGHEKTEQSFNEDEVLARAREYVYSASSLLVGLGERGRRIAWLLEDVLTYFDEPENADLPDALFKEADMVSEPVASEPAPKKGNKKKAVRRAVA